MAFIEPMHRNKPNITYLLTSRFIFVNSVTISSIISCNDLYQDFIIMYV